MSELGNSLDQDVLLPATTPSLIKLQGILLAVLAAPGARSQGARRRQGGALGAKWSGRVSGAGQRGSVVAALRARLAEQGLGANPNHGPPPVGPRVLRTPPERGRGLPDFERS